MDLERFVQAQESTFAQALSELRQGRKQGHWIWFVFPQVAGLGRSATAQRYALVDVDQGRAYLRHRVLGPRLRTCTQALLALDSTDPVAVLGAVDAMKVRSCMTLFALADPADPSFTGVLERWYGGAPDPRTLELVNAG